jgi:glycyl-tRNA synthetase
MGIAARGDYDLQQHSQASGKALEYTENSNNSSEIVKFVPHVIEPSLGVDRLVLALLTSAYREETLSDGDKRIVLGLKPYLAPIKAVVLPVVSNKPELVAAATKVHLGLRASALPSEIDTAGGIGRRYRR